MLGGKEMLRATLVAATASIAVIGLSAGGAAPSTKNVNWSYYHADAGGTHYSPLKQINSRNVARLQPV